MVVFVTRHQQARRLVTLEAERGSVSRLVHLIQLEIVKRWVRRLLRNLLLMGTSIVPMRVAWGTANMILLPVLMLKLLIKSDG